MVLNINLLYLFKNVYNMSIYIFLKNKSKHLKINDLSINIVCENRAENTYDVLNNEVKTCFKRHTSPGMLQVIVYIS